jgi:hypothetical protein
VPITDKQRHDLFSKLEEALGPEHAATMMELLPPVGWADVATKHDLDALRVATRHDLDALRSDMRAELSDLRSDIRRDLITWLLTGMGIQTATIGLLLALTG